MTTPGGHRRYDLDEVHATLTKGHTADGSDAFCTRGEHDGRRISGPLDAFVGKWVASDSPTDVVAAADTPKDSFVGWTLNREAKWGIVRIPTSPDEAEVVGPW